MSTEPSHDAVSERRVPPRVYLIPALIALALCLAFHQGFRASDELLYARAAVALQPGDYAAPVFREADHRDARIGTVLPLAAVFLVAGPTETALAALPFLCTIIAAGMIAWLTARWFGDLAGLLAGSLYAFFPLATYLSSFYAPEPILIVELCVATAMYMRLFDHPDDHSGFWIGVVAGVAYLTTEAGALLLPIFGVHLLVSKRLRARHVMIVGGFVCVFIGELAYNALMHGSAAYRYAKTSDYDADPMLVAANRNLFERFFLSYPRMIVEPYARFGVHGLLLVAGGVTGLARFRTRGYFVLWAAIILGFYNFMSGSLSHYVALPVADRLILPGLVPLFPLAGAFLADVWNWPRVRALRPVMVAYGAVVVCTAVVSSALNRAPDVIGIVARNAQSAARVLKSEPAATIVTDKTTATAIQFYRCFAPGDAYVQYAQADSSALARGAIPVYVVKNNVLFNERGITGHEYGDGLSLSAADRAAADGFQPPANVRVAPIPSPRFPQVTALMHYRPTAWLLDRYNTRQASMMLQTTPSLSDVLVFKHDQ